MVGPAGIAVSYGCGGTDSGCCLVAVEWASSTVDRGSYSPCGASSDIVSWTVTKLRCIPGFSVANGVATGAPPDILVMDQIGAELLTEFWSVRTRLECCLNGTDPDPTPDMERWAVTTMRHMSPAGCLGWQIGLTCTIPTVCC